MADIPEPLSRWQAFRIDKPEGLRDFCDKLLTTYDILFDDVLFRTHSKTYLKNTLNSKIIDSTTINQNSGSHESQKLIDHFDRRFFELASKLNVRSQYINYNITVHSTFDGEHYEIEIAEGHTVQDVLDQIWEFVSEHVDAYTYLERWVLVHEKTGLHLIIREIAHAIPATAIFAPGAKWIAKALTSPYKPADSAPRITVSRTRLIDY